MERNEHDLAPDVSDEEAAARHKGGLMALVRDIVSKEKESWTAEMAAELKGYEAPDRSTVPDPVPSRYEDPQHQGRLRLGSPLDALYRRMPEEVRRFGTRTPTTGWPRRFAGSR
jgi:hypothetical protein